MSLFLSVVLCPPTMYQEACQSVQNGRISGGIARVKFLLTKSFAVRTGGLCKMQIPGAQAQLTEFLNAPFTIRIGSPSHVAITGTAYANLCT